MIAIIEIQKEITFEVDLSDNLLKDTNLDRYMVDGKIDGLFSESNMIHDVWRYQIEVKDDEYKMVELIKEIKSSDFGDRLTNRLNYETSKSKIIILLLESPHKKEFIYNEGIISPKAPAQGKSPGDAGGAIKKYLTEILKKIELKEGDYSVIISNPVPYHASLGHFKKGKLDRALRNHVWTKIWSIDHVQLFFKEKLQKYKPIIIINCCTANLTTHVNCFLCEKGYASQTYVVPHPAVNWNITKGNTEVINLKKCNRAKQ